METIVPLVYCYIIVGALFSILIVTTTWFVVSYNKLTKTLLENVELKNIKNFREKRYS